MEKHLGKVCLPGFDTYAFHSIYNVVTLNSILRPFVRLELNRLNENIKEIRRQQMWGDEMAFTGNKRSVL